LNRPVSEIEVRHRKARIVHSQIVSLLSALGQAKVDPDRIEEMVAPYYELLDSIYEEGVDQLSAEDNRSQEPVMTQPGKIPRLRIATSKEVQTSISKPAAQARTG